MLRRPDVTPGIGTNIMMLSKNLLPPVLCSKTENELIFCTRINTANYMNFLRLIIELFIPANNRLDFDMKHKRRRDYYRNEYLKSDEWKRKRYVVLRRDNWRCVYCGARATQVHHKKYARKNIGKEPIEWLVSVCKPCHDSQHH